MVTNSRGRWMYGGQHAPRNYPWPQCRFCGRAQDRDCPPATCQLCGSVLCHGAGADCKVCHHGFIPGWSRQATQRRCGRKHCAGEAVAKAPRVGQVCAEHAKVTTLRLVGGRTLTITDYVAERIAHRDSGNGWESFRWRNDPLHDHHAARSSTSYSATARGQLVTDPRQTDPDNTRQPESEQDERGLLYISDVQAMRRADSICFQVRRDGTAHIDANLTTWAYPEPRIFTATQQRLFPDAHHTDRRRRIHVGATIVGFDSDRRWHEHAIPGACASAMIHAAGLDDVWGSIAGFIRVGDVMTLHWRTDNNNQVLIDAGLHRDELRIGIRRGKRSWTFLVDVAIGPDNTTRMIGRAAPH